MTDNRLANIERDRADVLLTAKDYVPGRFVPGSFSVWARDTYHFDVGAERRPGYIKWWLAENPTSMAYPLMDGGSERAFAIRGEPGNIYIRDERWDPEAPRPRPLRQFASVEAAMAWVTAELLIGAPA